MWSDHEGVPKYPKPYWLLHMSHKAELEPCAKFIPVKNM